MLQRSLREREAKLVLREQTTSEDAKMLEERGLAWTTREQNSRQVC